MISAEKPFWISVTICFSLKLALEPENELLNEPCGHEAFMLARSRAVIPRVLPKINR